MKHIFFHLTGSLRRGGTSCPRALNDIRASSPRILQSYRTLISASHLAGQLSVQTKSPWVWIVKGACAEDALPRDRVIRSRHAEFVKPASLKHELPKNGRPEVAFAGRSNAGKSTLIGELLGNPTLVRTSKEAGCTKTVNFFVLGESTQQPLSYLVDLPGYGFAKQSRHVVRRWTTIVRAYLEGRPPEVLRRTFVLVDSRHGLQQGDEEMLTLLDDAGVTNQVVLTKVDKIPKLHLLRSIESVCQAVVCRPASLPVIHCVSAVEGHGMAEFMNAVWDIADI